MPTIPGGLQSTAGHSDHRPSAVGRRKIRLSAPGGGQILSSRWILAGIILIGLARGLFWVAATEIPNPVDEAHHLAYIDHLATGQGIPTVGVDFLPEPILELLRDSPTLGIRRHPFDPSQPEQWGVSAHQYEGVQPPLYYALMVPAYYAGGAVGDLGSLYAVRVASVLLSLASIPLAWLLAKELFPDRRWIWMFSALLPAVVQGFNANPASVTNDALVLPFGAAFALAAARSLRRLTWKGALWPGLIVGLATLTKLNAVALIPILGIALLVLPQENRRSLWWRVRWGMLASAVAAAVSSLWLAWNLFAYGKLSGGSEAAEVLLASLQLTFPFTLHGVLSHLQQAQSGFWQFQRFNPLGPGIYGWLFLAAAGAAVAGVATCMARSRKQDAARLAWLASFWPVAFLGMLAIVYLAYTGTVVGRHTYPVLIPLLVFIAGGIAAPLGRRLGPICLAILIAGGLWLEQGETKRYLDQAYLEHLVIPGVAPAWEQPFNGGSVEVTGVTVTSPCPVEIIGLGIQGSPPIELPLETGGRTRMAILAGEEEGLALYTLPDPQTDLNVAFESPTMLGAIEESPGPMRFSGEASNLSPMAQIQCRMDNWKENRFDQRFQPFHVDWITYGRALAWGRGWAVAGTLFAIAVVLGQSQSWIRERRDGRESPSTASGKP